jgi:hypothetical protein
MTSNVLNENPPAPCRRILGNISDTSLNKFMPPVVVCSICLPLSGPTGIFLCFCFMTYSLSGTWYQAAAKLLIRLGMPFDSSSRAAGQQPLVQQMDVVGHQRLGVEPDLVGPRHLAQVGE